jgi:hypothetical protein
MWPTTNDPRTVFVTVRLTASEAADLDAHAAAGGMSRSQAVRDAVDRVIAASKRKKSQS